MVRRILKIFVCVIGLAGLFLFAGLKGSLLLILGMVIGYIARGQEEQDRRRKRYVYRKKRKFSGRIIDWT